CKDLGRNGQNRAITPKATYTPIPNRAGSRSRYKNARCVLAAGVFVMIGWGPIILFFFGGEK
ncbi:hypothetical protein, partial [Lacticaseibacillus rhamnosus]|uniref:hypothetical protein n=1 Tax=Lacticaseibacillus rhamnosus TaxID=47715 RepID=UPI0006677E43